MKTYSTRTEGVGVVSNILKVQTTVEDHGKHIAQKPLKLMELLVSLVTVEGQVVLDPFMGSGTTCLAAKRLGRHYIGIDADPTSVQMALERLDDVQQNGIAL